MSRGSTTHTLPRLSALCPISRCSCCALFLRCSSHALPPPDQGVDLFCFDRTEGQDEEEEEEKDEGEEAEGDVTAPLYLRAVPLRGRTPLTPAPRTNPLPIT